jgi:hypothetical protein
MLSDSIGVEPFGSPGPGVTNGRFTGPNAWAGKRLRFELDFSLLLSFDVPAEGAEASRLRGGEEMLDAQLNAFQEGKKAYP